MFLFDGESRANSGKDFENLCSSVNVLEHLTQSLTLKIEATDKHVHNLDMRLEDLHKKIDNQGIGSQVSAQHQHFSELAVRNSTRVEQVSDRFDKVQLHLDTRMDAVKLHVDIVKADILAMESDVGALRERVDSCYQTPVLPADTTNSQEIGRCMESSDMTATTNEPESSQIGDNYKSVNESVNPVALQEIEARCSDIEVRLDVFSKELKALIQSSEGKDVKEEVPFGSKAYGVCATAECLDQNDIGYTIAASMWEACLLMGFDCVGVGVSILLGLGAMINAGIQLLFTMIVFGNLADGSLSSLTIEAVKHWRGVIGHNAQHVNPVSQTSLVAQLCAADDALQLSAFQFSLYTDVRDFLMPSNSQVQDMQLMWLNGRCLCDFALLLWLMSIAVDVLHNKAFLIAVCCVPRGEPTIHETDEGLKITHVSHMQIMLVVFFSCLPRFFTAFFLGYMGMRFLAHTTNIAELMLNTMALTFVLEIDEQIFVFLAPRRVKILISQLVPIPTHESNMDFLGTLFGGRLHWLQSGHFQALSRLIVCLSAVVILDQILVAPFAKDMREVKKWMCDGDRDFAYTVSKASGAVYHAQTRPFNSQDYGTFYTKTAVLSLTGIEDANTSAEAWYVRGPNPGGVTGISIMESSWEELRAMHLEDAAYAANLLTCQDKLGAENVGMEGGSNPYEALIAKTVLREMTGNASLESCSDIPQQLCFEYIGTYIRAWCPDLCGCKDPWVGLFYGTSRFGCPRECNFGYNVRLKSEVPDALQDTHPYCRDAPSTVLMGEPSWVQWVSSLLPVIFKMGHHKLLDEFIGMVKPGANSSDPNNVVMLGCDLVNILKRKGFQVCHPDSGLVGRSARPWCPHSCNCNLGSHAECPPNCDCSVGECEVLYNPETKCDLGMCHAEEKREWYEILVDPPDQKDDGRRQPNDFVRPHPSDLSSSEATDAPNDAEHASGSLNASQNEAPNQNDEGRQHPKGLSDASQSKAPDVSHDTEHANGSSNASQNEAPNQTDEGRQHPRGSSDVSQSEAPDVSHDTEHANGSSNASQNEAPNGSQDRKKR